MSTKSTHGSDRDQKKKEIPVERTERYAAVMPQPSSKVLVEFLLGLFLDGHPQKIVLASVHGSTGSRIGPTIREVAVRPATKMSPEEAVELGNTLLAAAQSDCDVLAKPTRYGIFAHDLMRSDRAYARFLLGLKPSGTVATVEDRAIGDGLDDEDNVMSTKLLLGLLNEERRDKRYMLEQTLHTLSGILERDQARIERMEGLVDGVWAKASELVAATEKALSQAAERERAAEWQRLKVEGVREAIGLLKTMVPATVARLSAGKIGVQGAIYNWITGLSNEQAKALFSDAEDGTVGVLSVEQSDLIIRITKGEEPEMRVLDFAASITTEQLAKAAEILRPEQSIALMQIFESVKAKAATNGAASPSVQ